jgi:hypothetical protein
LAFVLAAADDAAAADDNDDDDDDNADAAADAFDDVIGRCATLRPLNNF